ncbi:MAG: cytochrome c [Candidatus Glassbacteria bacterium]|nr:cytochrome c [Candidatus Glassbacteria bacterium]
MSSTRNKTALLVLLAIALGGGCIRSRSEREWQYMPDMYVSPAVKAQEADADGNTMMRVPPEGTVPIGETAYQVAQTDTLSAMALVNPLPVNEQVLAVGKKYFNIYCVVCHGPRGAGDGPIIPKMPPPPPLYSEKVSGWSDGRIYHVISWGQGNMPSYSSSIDPATRWAVIHYLRAVQRAENPPPEDVRLYEQQNPDGGDTKE